MNPYDPNKRYLGPQGHWLNKVIPEYPLGAPAELKELWNQAAYRHDEDFEGDEFVGFWGWVKKYNNRKEVRREIEKANLKFGNSLILAVEKTRSQMVPHEVMIAFKYANIVKDSVDKFGFAFYKTGGAE